MRKVVLSLLMSVLFGFVSCGEGTVQASVPDYDSPSAQKPIKPL